jgi:iron complex transport system ATP-binding protein
MKLEADNITIEIRHHKIINELSLSFERGELVGLIGPNGAGKTTLLKAIIGAEKYSQGQLTLDGVPLKNLSPVERAKTLAYLPQESRIEWQLQARAVVMLGRFPYRRTFGPPSIDCERAVDNALDAVNATSFSFRSLNSLSGGERALILLARTLAVGAPLVLVDEPIAELDPYHQIHVMDILKAKANEGIGVLAVLHDLTMAAHFMDRLILINNGSVVAEGVPKEVLTKANLEEVYRISPRQEYPANTSIALPWKTKNVDT